MKTIQDILEGTKTYLSAMDDETLNDLEVDINKEKPGMGTKLKAEFLKVRENLEKEEAKIQAYQKTVQPALKASLEGLIGKFENFRDNGGDAEKALGDIDKALEAFRKVSPLDRELMQTANDLNFLINFYKVRDRFIAAGGVVRNAYADKKMASSDAISALVTERQSLLNSFGQIFLLQLTKATLDLSNAKKKLDKLVKALGAFNTFLSLIARVAGILL